MASVRVTARVAARAQSVYTVEAHYEGAQLDTTGALLTSTNQANYLEKVTALDRLDAEMVKSASAATCRTSMACAALPKKAGPK